MITVTETSKRELVTPDDIATYLQQRYAAGDTFKPGEVVTIGGSIGVGNGVGGVGVVAYDPPGSPWSWVIILSSTGAEIPAQIATERLTKRAAVQGDGK